MIRTLLLLTVIISFCSEGAAARGFRNPTDDTLGHYGINRRYIPVHAPFVAQQNCYLLCVLGSDPGLKDPIIRDSVLRRIDHAYRSSLVNLSASCEPWPVCFTRRLMWDTATIHQAQLRLSGIFRSNPLFRKLLHRHITESGRFVKWYGETDEAIMLHAFAQEMTSLNLIIRHYMENKGFRYPDIDSNRFYTGSRSFRLSLDSLLRKYRLGKAPTGMCFQPLMQIAFDLLAFSGHNEASRNEPLINENRQAVARISLTQWDRYPYSAILVFGEGPSNGDAISRGSMDRCDVAIGAYKAGKAPFIIVSGGYVHPFLTRYSEAVEMRKYLEKKYHVPAAAILLEPHARHTTTNMRNAGRLIYNYGIPCNKRILGISSKGHIDYIASPVFDWKNKADLGYLPFRDMKRVGEHEVEFLPVFTSLFPDAADPLDP